MYFNLIEKARKIYFVIKNYELQVIEAHWFTIRFL